MFNVEIGVADDTGSRFESFDACVDTGASYTWLPRPTLEALGHTPTEDYEFELADGRKVHYGVKYISVRVDGRTVPTPVVFGEPGTTPLLGAVTLQEASLGVDSVNEKLIKIPARLGGPRLVT